MVHRPVKSGGSRQGDFMTHSKKFEPDNAPVQGFSIHPKRFVFLDNKSGTKRFEVCAGEDGSLPMDEAVSLLAVHCLARKQLPRDFSILVSVGDDLVDGLAGRAAELIHSCANDTKTSVALSRRQREVLRGVSQNLSNKEIAGELNVSVRTVKFHVSALLEKFDVRGRSDLMLETMGLLPETVRKRNANSQHSPAPQGGAAQLSVGATASRLQMPLDRRASR
jgi:DNA-binding CsgD family transcriptional regulator